MTYAELQEAVAEFNLPPQVTLKKIRERHRQLVRRYHPDNGANPDNEKIRRVNAAYRILNEYISHYNFNFSRDTFLEQYPEERVREQFYDVGLWGGKG